MVNKKFFEYISRQKVKCLSIKVIRKSQAHITNIKKCNFPFCLTIDCTHKKKTHAHKHKKSSSTNRK